MISCRGVGVMGWLVEVDAGYIGVFLRKRRADNFDDGGVIRLFGAEGDGEGDSVIIRMVNYFNYSD